MGFKTDPDLTSESFCGEVEHLNVDLKAQNVGLIRSWRIRAAL